MTSSNSSCSRAFATCLAAALAVGSGCAHRRGAAWPGHGEGEPLRVAVLPPENATGVAAPEREIGLVGERALAREGIEVVSGAAVDEFLARHKLRDTGGLPADVAVAARRELGVSGILVTSLVLYSPTAPPRFGVVARLLSTEDDPRILWMDGFGRAGDDAPGLLGLGIVEDVTTLEREAFRALAGSLATFLREGAPRAPRCPTGRAFAPAIAFRSPALGRGPTLSVAILPFVNQTTRRAAGQAVALQVARQLLADARVHLVEPGTLREQMLDYRITAEGGASLDAVRLLARALKVELVIGGIVRDYLDQGMPVVGFTVLAIDAKSEEVRWESTSFNRGDDTTLLFGTGGVSTADALACRMTRAAIDAMLEPRKVTRIGWH
jgi:hypothetical protein